MRAIQDAAIADLRRQLEECRAERDAALAREAALAEVMDAINRSPGDLTPVFQAIVEKAHTLCNAAYGSFQLWNGEKFRAVALRGFSGEMSDRLQQGYSPYPNMPCRSLVEGERVAHCIDLAQIDDPTARSGVELGGVRTILYVALRNDNALLGQIVAARREVRPFKEKEIALVENFADQAVIAMENARLLTEQREALEQQTATAEILQAINESRDDLTRVFDAMLEKAMRLCQAAFGELHTFDGERYVPGVTKGVPAPYSNYRAQHTRGGEIRLGTIFDRIRSGLRYVHITDLMSESLYHEGDPGRHAMVHLGGARTLLAVPLRRGDACLGLIAIYRKEVRPFSDKQIALLENFAVHAGIAIENVRLLSELRQRTHDLQEALEYQTATSDVLKVISRSVFELNTVLQTVIASAVNLCRAERAILYRYRDGHCHFEVGYNNDAEYEELERSTPIAPSRESLVGRTMLERRVVQIVDAWNDPEYGPKDDARLNDVHSMLGVPLLRDGELIGVFGLARTIVAPYTERQIELVTTFADQAVIAIANSRLLSELQARTEELAQRQSELRITFENMGDGVALFDGSSRLVAWNCRFQELFALPDALLEQHGTYEQHLRFLAARGDFGAQADVEEQIRHLTTTTDRPEVYERTRPDGRVLEIRRNPVPSGDFVLIFSDITERKGHEAEIRTARDAAEAAYRELKAAQANLIQAEKMASLGQLTAGIAHEIKNPLNFVNNFADLSVELLNEMKTAVAPALPLLGPDRRAEIDEALSLVTGNLAKITEHGRRADGIVRSMLEHSHGGSGDRRRVDLNLLVEEALNLAYHGARAQDQSFNFTLQRDLSEGIAPIEVVPQDLTRVLLNLFSNGFYTARQRQRTTADPGFEPTLKVSTRDLCEEVEIRVRDNGTGIPAGIRAKLFQPFFTTKPTGEGTGLGLSISYDIITQQHGGSITVDSKVGEYSEFTIRLPRTPRRH